MICGNFLRVQRVSPDGDVVRLIDLMGTGLDTADYEYVADKNLFVVPVIFGDKVVAHEMSWELRRRPNRLWFNIFAQTHRRPTKGMAL